MFTGLQGERWSCERRVGQGGETKGVLWACGLLVSPGLSSCQCLVHARCTVEVEGGGKVAMSQLSLGDTTIKGRWRYIFYFAINHRIKQRGWASQELSPVLLFSLENASPSSEKHLTVPALWTFHSMYKMYWRINSTAEQRTDYAADCPEFKYWLLPYLVLYLLFNFLIR